MPAEELTREFAAGATKGKETLAGQSGGQATKYNRTSNIAELKKLVDSLFSRDRVGFALSQDQAGRLSGVAFSSASGTADFFDLENCADREEAVRLLGEVFENGLPEERFAGAGSPWPALINSVIFTPDSKKLIASGYHELTVWDVESGQLEKRIHTRAERAHEQPETEIVLAQVKTLIRPGASSDRDWLPAPGQSAAFIVARQLTVTQKNFAVDHDRPDVTRFGAVNDLAEDIVDRLHVNGVQLQ